MAKLFQISVQVIIIAQNKVLTIHRSKFSDGTPCDIWTLPGEKIGAGENELETLQRYLKDQFNFEVAPQKATFVGYLFPEGPGFSFQDGSGVMVLNFKTESDVPFALNNLATDKTYEWLDYDKFLQIEFHSIKIKGAAMLNRLIIREQ